jgi:hypothetical protein
MKDAAGEGARRMPVKRQEIADPPSQFPSTVGEPSVVTGRRNVQPLQRAIQASETYG